MWRFFVLKKFRIIYLIYLIIITVVGCAPVRRTSADLVKVNVYFADKQMMRLVPVDYYISEGSEKFKCEKILAELTRERDYDSNIRRILPHEDSVSVEVKDSVAIVDIRSEYFSEFEKVRAMENLIVYQIVNSLTTVEGVSRVEFLIDGEKKKNFFGFMDMREAFIPDYYV